MTPDPTEAQPTLHLAQLVYSPKELEPILKLSKNTINALLRSGRLRSVRVGRLYLVPREAITDFLAGVAA